MDMHHIFLLNPAAGHSDQTAALREKIDEICRRRGLEYCVLLSQYKGHISELTAEYAASHPHVPCVFYACGGDGTLNETVTGALGFDNASVACYACGTGNDFIKLFTDPDAFRDLERVIDGQAAPFDAMTVETAEGERRAAINICSAGIDARVADWVGRNKRRFAFGGKLIYDLSLAKAYFAPLSRYYKVTVDGKSYDDDYSILVAASGRYYGGGYYAVPEAEPDDGVLDFLFVKKVGHIGLLTLIGKYQAGRHREFGDTQIFLQGQELILESRDPEPVNFDGEILSSRRVAIRRSPDKLPVIVPRGTELIRTGKENMRIQEENRVNSSKPG